MFEVVDKAERYNYTETGKAWKEAGNRILFPRQENEDSGGNRENQRKTYAAKPRDIA
jgi:hypothetical protein